MKKAPTFARTFSGNPRLTVFSNNRPLSWLEINEVWILAHWPESDDAPREISLKRQAFKTRVDTAEHLSNQGLPPIVSSYDYEILKLQGRVN